MPALHHTSIRHLQTLHPSYSPAVRMLTVWLARNHLSSQLSQEMLEVLVARAFIRPMHLNPPGSPLLALHHTLLL